MFDTHQLDGTWWVAKAPRKKLAGTLTVERGDASLKVLGNFASLPLPKDGGTVLISDWTKHGKPTRIVGRTSDTEEEITLEGALVDDFPANVTTYEPSWVLVGKAFRHGEEIEFDEMVVEFSELDAWVGASGFARIPYDAEEPPSRVGGILDIKFDAPPSIDIPLGNGEEASIEFSWRHSGWRAVTTSITVTHRAALRLRFAEPHSLNALAHRVGQLRNFLGLAVGRPVSVLSVTGYRDDHTRRRKGQKPELLPIKLYWEIPHNADPRPAPLHPFKMAFTLAEAPGGIAEALRRWFAMDTELRPVFILFFSTRQHPDLYRETRFLTYAQAIEAYDRLTRDKPNASLSQRMRAALATAPTVRKKLLEAAGASLDDFVVAFQDTRDFYTHYNPRPKSQALRDARLFVMVVVIQAVIEMVLLRRLGFTDAEIDGIFTQRTERYREIKNFKDQITDEDLIVPED